MDTVHYVCRNYYYIVYYLVLLLVCYCNATQFAQDVKETWFPSCNFARVDKKGSGVAVKNDIIILEFQSEKVSVWLAIKFSYRIIVDDHWSVQGVGIIIWECDQLLC